MVLLDSGAAVSFVMSCLTPYFTSVYPSLTCAAVTADGNSLSVSDQGELGPLSNVLILILYIRHNCISVSQLSDIGIIVSFTPTGVAVANGRREGGLYKLSLRDLLSLSSVSVCNIGSQRPDVDDLVLWHRRLADTSHRAIREAVLNKLIEGVTLDCKYFNIKSRKSYRRACDICARAKMHQISFPPVGDRLEGLSPGARMSADVLIMQNIPSREGYRCVLFIVDHSCHDDVLGVSSQD